MKQQNFVSRSTLQTKKFAVNLAKDLETGQKATVIGLQGNLGAGKTTFAQGFAKGLGIKEKITSPTFVILRKFNIPKANTTKVDPLHYKGSTFVVFFHIDAYRLQNAKDLLALGWKEILANPQNIILVEWSDRVKKILPKNTLWVYFKTITKNQRSLRIVGREWRR